MASDQMVTSRMILDVLMELKRRGSEYALSHLEQIEPDLASYVMESLSLVHTRLLSLGGPPKRTSRLQRQIETTLLVSIAALRKAAYESWKDTVAGTSVPELDADDDGIEQPPPNI